MGRERGTLIFSYIGLRRLGSFFFFGGGVKIVIFFFFFFLGGGGGGVKTMNTFGVWRFCGYFFGSSLTQTQYVYWVRAQELEVRSLNHSYSLKTKSSQCHYVMTP